MFLLDKPAGISSFAALGALKRSIGTGKVGHAGTLDPFATGLLIAASGKMTRMAGMLTGLEKEYEAVFRFGAETDTLDPEGQTTAEAEVPDFGSIESALPSFIGNITQVPPAFSAVKIGGKRAYKRARDGQDVQMPSREITVHAFEILEWNAPDLRVRIGCSKGTYIRSIARDLGLAAGSRAYCLELRRTMIGGFHVDNAFPPDSVGEPDGMQPAEFCRSVGIDVADGGDENAVFLRQGIPVGRLDLHRSGDSDILYTDSSGSAAALVEWTGGKGRYRIVFD